jgi:hypothetical protein
VKGNVKAGGLVQVVKHLLSIASEGSEFKPQYHKKKKKVNVQDNDKTSRRLGENIFKNTLTKN